MRNYKALPKLAISAVALTTLLTACSGTTTDPTTPAPTTAASTPAEQPTVEETTAAPSEEASETPTEMPTEEVSPTDAPSDSEAPTPPPTGPLSGAKLDANGIAWFGAYCTGLKEATSHASPDTKGMTIKEAQQVAADTYNKLGTALTKASSDLGALDGTMNFEGSKEFAAFVVSTLADVGQVYSTASEEFAAASFTKESEMADLVEQTEAKAVAAGSSGFGMKSLDASIKNSVGTDVPECADVG